MTSYNTCCLANDTLKQHNYIREIHKAQKSQYSYSNLKLLTTVYSDEILNERYTPLIHYKHR